MRKIQEDKYGLNNEYIEYLKSVGRYTELVADMKGLGWNPTEIAQKFGTTRQNVDRMLASHSEKLRLQAEQTKFLTQRKVGRPKKEK